MANRMSRPDDVTLNGQGCLTHLLSICGINVTTTVAYNALRALL